MTRDDHGAAVLVMLIDGFLEYVVECVDLTLHRAAVLEIDEGIFRHIEDIARGNYIGLAEVHYRIAIRACVRFIEHLDAFAVMPLATPFFEIGIGRDGLRWRFGSLHSDLHVVLRDEGSTMGRVAKETG